MIESAVADSLEENVEIIEAGYEFLLAYAAQGREDDAGSEVRETLIGMLNATTAIADMLVPEKEGFSPVVVDDAKKSHAAISLVLTQKKISSELIDNLNASIHLRALLTDLFLLSEINS